MLIVGEGPAVEHLRQLARQLGIAPATRFIGYLDRDTTLLDCYSAGDVFIFASRTETQGLVLLESMAQGTPVLSTAHMGTRDILEKSQGALIVEEDAEVFSASLAGLLINSLNRQLLSKHARDDARKWSTREMTERLLQLYTKLMSQKHTQDALVANSN